MNTTVFLFEVWYCLQEIEENKGDDLVKRAKNGLEDVEYQLKDQKKESVSESDVKVIKNKWFLARKCAVHYTFIRQELFDQFVR